VDLAIDDDHWRFLFRNVPKCSRKARPNGIIRTDEDELTAIHLRNRLEGRPGNKQAVRQVILAGGEVGRFYDPARLGHRPEDVEIALDIDRYDFAIRVECQNGRPIARLERTA
jgi:2-phosphosulfolactate phosphatase